MSASEKTDPVSQPVTIEDLLKFEFIGNLKGKDDTVLFVRADLDLKKNYLRNLMSFHPETGKITQMTNRNTVGNYFIADGQTVYFAEPVSPDELDEAQKDESEEWSRLMVLHLDGGEAMKIADLPLSGAGILGLSESGSFVLTYTERFKSDPFRADPDYEVFDEAPWTFNNEGVVNGTGTSIALYDPKTEDLKKDLAGKLRVSNSILDSKKNRIFFTGQEVKQVSRQQERIYVLDLETLETSLIVSEPLTVFEMKLSEKGLYMAASRNERYGLNENPFLYLLDPENGEVLSTLEWDEAYGNTVGTDCAVIGGNASLVYEDTFYFVSTIVDHCNIYCWDGKTLHEALEWDGSINSFCIEGNVLYFIGARPDETLQLWKKEQANEPERLSDFNAFLQERYVARAKPVIYEAHNGQDQMGWVLFPKNFDPDCRYPGILDIHGGPKTVYGRIFYHEMQVWASKGYFVFFCNPFGSDGQGNAYADLRGKYGTVDFDDLMLFTDAVLREIPYIDPDRLAVTGGSYGGFMTNWVIGHTGRFKAAASQRSISNWTSFYGTSDIGPDFTRDQQQADLTNIPKLWAHSPLSAVQNVTTPTLFIHSDEDYRCPLEQGLQMMQSVMEQSVPARMCLFHKENHELSRSGQPKHRIRRLAEITRWFEIYNPPGCRKSGTETENEGGRADEPKPE